MICLDMIFDRRSDIVAGTRRRWSWQGKFAIVQEASGPCVNISAVARRHGIQPALLYRWKKELSDGSASDMTLDPVVVAAPVDGHDSGSAREETLSISSDIEITLANGRRLKVAAGIEPGALKRLLSTIDD